MIWKKVLWSWHPERSSPAPEEDEHLLPLVPEETWHGQPGPFLQAALQ